MTILHCIITFV